MGGVAGRRQLAAAHFHDLLHFGHAWPMMQSPRSARMLYVPQLPTSPAQSLALHPVLNLAKAA